MAEMISINKQKKERKFSRRSTRVDLTPMVDLGFLLITFFVFTTTMSERKVMNAMVPDDKDSTINDLVCESCALTLIPGANNTLVYYEGIEKYPVYKTTGYAASGLRKLIMQKKQHVMEIMHNDKLVMIIKPSPESNFKNLVDLIDEASICRVKRYYITELSDEERKHIK
ncbi:MAG: biopolymer transporter ExbD [Ferruginibacter sp.]